MVFESVVTDVLNRVLGDYVENLDSKQLKIGIWGGDVVLKDLILKPTALDELDLPVQTVYGRLGKLVLKIPWKNLYGSPVEASIEGLYLLVVPNQQAKYDSEKEEKKEVKAKQDELQRIEDAKKKEAEKDKPKADDTFVEKLTAQIIKNVQVKISNIHIRYEDKVTHLNHPFAMGITLSNLSLETTDETWKPTIVQEMVTKIYKVVSLEGLAVYWNCNSILYANLPTVDLLHRFNNEIATKTTSPDKYQYLLGPINSSARLRLNPKPDCDMPSFSIPKVHLNFEMEKLFIGISKAQYQDIIALAESMDRMSRGVPYRQFRPDLTTYKGHYKEWWHFAYACVLDDVRRRRRNWDWNHIKQHRDMCKDYAKIYHIKLIQKKIPQNIQEKIDRYEKNLDIFNIVIIRQKIELDVARTEKVQAQVTRKSWLSSWWSNPEDEYKELSDSFDIVKKFEDAMTPEEKSRLYKAIDYQENCAPLEFPEAYVDNTCTFVLRLLEIQVRDDLSRVPRVMSTKLQGVKCRLDTRPAASAVRVAVNIDEFIVFGLQQDDLMPELVTSKTQAGPGEGGALLDVLFETNPLDKTCSQRVHVNVKPLQIIYDAQTINKIVDVFRIPSSSALEQLSAAAENSLNNFKEMSATGLQHAIEHHTVLDLKIDLFAPYVIIPYGGKYTGSENVLVINLGHLKISSTERPESKIDVRQLYAKGAAEQEILEEMIAQSYDMFNLEFTALQIVLAQGGEDWNKYVNESTVTAWHLLHPMCLNLTFYKCLISDDPRLPLTKIKGQLPSLAVNITDVRLLLLVALATSIPMPEESPPEGKPLLKSSRSQSSSQSMLKYLELSEKPKPSKAIIGDDSKLHKTDFVQFTTLDVQFVIKELSVEISHQEMSSSPSEKIVGITVSALEFDLIQQTYNTEIIARLGGIAVDQCHKDNAINIISTPLRAEEGTYLFIVKFMQVDRKSPEFHSKYYSCESRLNLEFSSLNVTLHQEALQALMKFGTELQMQVEELRNPVTGPLLKSSVASMEKVRRLSSVAESFVAGVKSSKTLGTLLPDRRGTKVVVETIQFKLTAHLQELMVLFACEKNSISSCAIKGITSEVIVKKSYTQVTARLLLITIKDLNPKSIHSEILTVTSDEAVNAQIVMYNAEHKFADPNSVDISVQVSLGCLKIVFLNWFVSNMLDFLNQFQAAQATIIEASQAAAQTAKQNMQNAYENSTRISLNIDFEAPDIIVPVSSQSYNALLLDLGHITISNRFLTLDIKNEQEQSAILDEIKLKLTNFTLARIVLDSKYDIISKNSLLEPVSFSLSVKRNLSTAWYRAVPDIDLSGKIDSITLLLSQSDYQMIMSVLSGNLAESQQPADASVVPSKSETQAVITKSTETTLLRTADSRQPGGLSAESEEQSSKVHTVVKFTLTMESFIINLFAGGSRTLSHIHMSPPHDSKNALARFSLEVLSVKGRILSDNSISTSLLLVNCLMDDMRKGREGKLNRLIERKYDSQEVEIPSNSTSTESVGPVRSMIDVTFQQKENDMFVDVRVFSFTVILSVDYLLKIAEFFTAAAEAEIQNKSKQIQSRTTLKDASTSRTNIPSKSDSTVVKKEGTMTLNLRIEKPDIVLVEYMDKIDTNALILNTEVIMKMRTSGSHQTLSGSINDIQLYTCSYDPLKRAETKGPVLHPVSISIAGSTPEGEGLHIEVCITEVRICVSPATIELLNRVYSTMYGGGATEADSDTQLEDYTNIWEYKPYNEQDLWYLKAETAEDAFEYIESTPSNEEGLEVTPLSRVKEFCIVRMPSLVLTIEAGVGNKTLPMLLLESSFSGNVKDWSSQLSVESSLTLQIGYYNSRLALWEPLIESVEVTNDNKTSYVPWELILEVSMNEQEEQIPSSPTEQEEEPVQNQQAAMSIDISSKTNLELTVTKTSLEVMNNLAKAFSNAIAMGAVKATEVFAPYKVKNDSGLQITLLLNKGAFKIYGQDNPVEVVLKSGAEVCLQLKPSLEVTTSLHLEQEMSLSSFRVVNRFLHIQIADLKCNLELPVIRADKRYFLLQHRGENNDSWGIVSAVIVEEGVLIINLRSILQVHNHFSTPVDVYYMTIRGNELECISTIEPGSSVNIPLKAVYTPTNELFFSVPGYCVTSTPFIWKDLQLNLSITKLMQCTPKVVGDNNEPFIIKAVGETEQIYHENTSRHTMASTCYNIHLYPAVTFKNCLPVDVICCVQNIAEEKLVRPGEVLQIPNVDPGVNSIVLRLPDYLEKEWSCQHEVVANPPPFAVWQFDSYDSVNKVSLDLGMHVLTKSGSTVMSLYCPFWMLNKTGLLISYRSSDESLNVLHHPATFKGPVLFSFSAKNFFGKKKASVRVEQGEWSDKFSLDVAGSSGFVVCKANNTIYQIGVHNQLTYNGLTKQVTFTPYYVIINNAPFAVECQELDRPADHWTRVEEKSCTALWPRSERDDKLLKLRVIGTEEVSAPFLYTETHTTLLKLPNKFGGIGVDIQMTEGAVYINLTGYGPGMAPALVINHTKDMMSLWEKETIQIRRLDPGHMALYTWENPSGPRVLVWDVGHKKELEDDLRKDGVGEFSPTENYRVYWVSFLDGMQRVLLFTMDRTVALQCSKQFEAIQQEITVSIHGLGLSLVNNPLRQEILYIGIASSGIIWESCKLHSRRFKQMNAKDSINMETAYQMYENRRMLSAAESSRMMIDGKTEVDFETLRMLRPHKKKIRRTFQTGLWLQMKTSPNQLQLHAKINRLQIDNQMFDCIFPVVLAPVPPPKSVAGDNVQKPFAELSIVERIIKYSQIRQFKYFKILIQEFHIKVDLGFVNAVFDLLQSSEYSEQEEQQQFLEDVKLVDEPLLSHVSTQSLQEQKNFYDMLHFSPLKVHVSFSLQTGSSSTQNTSTPNFLNVLLQGLGVTLTDMQDVVFRLAYFQREYSFLTQRQLISEATTHYVGQSVKQLYVLVLGLDVLGNPYGLVLGITKGVEDLFYEPFQGAIQGPGEFAEGLVLGVRSLFGHTVGGAAGAVSRITGAMGKGIAALTFDKDYQRKRRDQINKKPATVQEGIARGGKGLVMGVVDGVTGVFTKPISGAKEQGVEGFFKGLGKGAVGLVTRPTAGVIDFASGSLDAVKRAAELGEETNRLRPPRFLQADGLVRPYNHREASGHKLLVELEKGKYAHTDVYSSHFIIIERKEILMLTDKRLAYMTHNDIFGGWQIDWAYTWQELQIPPKCVPKGIAITAGETKKKKLGLFGSSDSGKIILVGDASVREEICSKIEELMKNA